MSVTIIQQPPKIIKAANAALWVVSGTNQASANFRYVADVSGTTLLGRLKCDKLPNNQGFFDVRKLARTLVVPTKPKIGFQFEDAKVLHSYTIGFREEFGTPPSVATGVTNASGLVMYGYDRPNEAFDIAKYVNTDGQDMSILSDRQNRKIRFGQNDYYSFLIPDYGTTDYQVFVNYPTRSFTYIDAIPSGSLSWIINTGAAGVTAIPSGITSDGFPGSYRFPGSWTVTDEWDTWNALCTADGASALESATCLFERFEALNNYDSGSTYSFVFYIISEDIAYTQLNYTLQTCERFAPVRLLWRNKLGGIDAYEFTMKNKLQADIERQTYRRNTDQFATVDVDTVYQAEIEETWNLESDWLAQNDSKFLSELLNSPEVYIEQPTELVPAVVQTTRYDFFQKPQDGLVRLSLQVKIGYKTTVL